ncbi:uncharacterized protein LOC108109489 [Drosophila eugracilis]|uniref:uncharacterized protein LOC108109489 n=1 Tax=Drosophila eugracilis TaxID=29029 RepID=UPI001BDB121A|nr:uncharacterized protein LOC108109489 [Drosophila eugracilis]
MDEEELASNHPEPSMVQSEYSRSRIVNQSSMTLAQGFQSAQLLFMGENFQQTRSEQDIFFDCNASPESTPRENRSATSRCKFDDPAAIREALERAANATQMLLKNFDKGGGWNQPCAVTLELTARLVDPKKSRAGCPLHGKPVTVQMPLEFNPQSGKMATCQQKQQRPSRQRKDSICQCRSQQRMHSAPRTPRPTTECPALMYTQDERHSDSDPNSRHQQTEQSRLKDHWKPSNLQSSPSDMDDPRAKPSQTDEPSFLERHHTPKSLKSKPESQPELDEVPVCSCKPKRAKSADPPPVRTPCVCRSQAQPCGQDNKDRSSPKKPSSARASAASPGGSFKTAITECTKELLEPCTCGSKPPYWAGQSNLVSGPSYSKAMAPCQSNGTALTIAPLQDPARTKPNRSKSLTSIPTQKQPNQSRLTWLSALKDPESDVCHHKQQEVPVSCSCNAAQTSQATCRSMATKSNPPHSQPSFGVDYETSATTRSQSIVGKITCLCASDQKSNKDYMSKLADSEYQECAGTSNIQPCPSTRIQHSCGLSEFDNNQTSQCNPSVSFRSRKVSLKDYDEEFCDCDASDRSSDLSDPIQTSLHTHRSLSGGSCLCDDDDPPPDDPSKSACVTKNCQCYQEDQGTGFQTPDDPCGQKDMSCCTRKQRILQLMDRLTTYECDCGDSRTSMIQQLFREMTLLLRSEKENAIAPADEPSPPCPNFDECCAAQHDRTGDEEAGEKPMSKKALRRVECFHQLEEYLRKCFLPPPEPEVPETDIYAFELDPDFPPDDKDECPQTPAEKPKPCRTENFLDVGNSLTCSGDDLDGDVFVDCEDDDEYNKGDCECDDHITGEPDLCQSLKAFINKEVQDIMEAEACREGNDLEQKTPSIILKEICEGSTNPMPLEEEEKPEQIECPFAGMVSCAPWTKVETDWATYPYNLDPCAKKKPPIPVSRGPRTGLLPDGPLTPEVRNLCEKLLRKALQECGLCDEMHSCEEDDGPIDCSECPPKECPEGEECPENPEDCPEECRPDSDECPPEGNECPVEEDESQCQENPPDQGCLCCHCRALICDEECKTVSNTLRSAMCDPLCEMKYFIDSMIVDMHAMDCVLGNKQVKPQDIRANDATNRTGPGDSFPVKISSVTSLGCSALYVRWKVEDCSGISGYEIYMDGHLTNRLYSFRHEAAVITNVDVTNPHQIVVRAHAVDNEFPGEGSGKSPDCGCQTMAVAEPQMVAGAARPWTASVFYYDPNQVPPAGGVQPC